MIRTEDTITKKHTRCIAFVLGGILLLLEAVGGHENWRLEQSVVLPSALNSFSTRKP